MKNILYVAFLLSGLGAFGSPRTVAQDTSAQAATFDTMTERQLTLPRKDIRSIKKQLIAANLTLTDDEAAKFWPTYDQYSADSWKNQRSASGDH